LPIHGPDHLRAGSESYFTSRGVRVSLHPAGHVLGSAQVRLEHRSEVWVVSGDDKRDPDPTCAPFEIVPCDVFISEATFALPVYRWTPTATVAADILAWWEANRDRGLASVLFAYALGKVQRVLAELAALTSEPVYVHGAVETLVEAYREAGIAMLPTRTPAATRRTDYAGALVLAPPRAAARARASCRPAHRGQRAAAGAPRPTDDAVVPAAGRAPADPDRQHRDLAAARRARGEPPFDFVHDDGLVASMSEATPADVAADRGAAFTLSGHVHPVTHLPVPGGRALRVPVFWRRAAALVLRAGGQ